MKRKEFVMTLESIIWGQIKSLVEQDKALSKGEIGNANFLNRANTLLTIDHYSQELKTWSSIDKTALESFLDSWESLKKTIKL